MTNLRRVDLNLLVILDALLAERSATRAATRLGMSQPAVSGALARLRGVLDDPLLIRTPRGLEPTARALEMGEPLRELLSGAQALIGGRAAFDPAALVREFRLGLSDYAAHVLLPRLLVRLARDAPGVDLVIIDGASRDTTADMLERKTVDLAVTVGPASSARIAVEPLFDDGWMVVARAGHPIWAGELAPASLAAWPALLISPEGDRYGIADRLLGELGLKRRVALTSSQFLTAPPALSASDLVALLPIRLATSVAEPYGLRTAPTPFPHQPRFTTSLTWHRRDGDDPAHAWLRRALLAAARPEDES